MLDVAAKYMSFYGSTDSHVPRKCQTSTYVLYRMVSVSIDMSRFVMVHYVADELNVDRVTKNEPTKRVRVQAAQRQIYADQINATCVTALYNIVQLDGCNPRRSFHISKTTRKSLGVCTHAGHESFNRFQLDVLYGGPSHRTFHGALRSPSRPAGASSAAAARPQRCRRLQLGVWRLPRVDGPARIVSFVPQDDSLLSSADSGAQGQARVSHDRRYERKRVAY